MTKEGQSEGCPSFKMIYKFRKVAYKMIFLDLKVI